MLVTSRGYEVSSMPLNEISLTNPQIKNIITNYYDKIIPSLNKYGEVLKNNLNDELSSFDFKFILLIILNGLIAIICAIFGVSFLLKVEDLKERVLFLFLEIPVANVEAISKRRDKFMEFFDSVSKME